VDRRTDTETHRLTEHTDTQTYRLTDATKNNTLFMRHSVSLCFIVLFMFLFNIVSGQLELFY